MESSAVDCQSAENSDSETTLMLVLLLFCRCMWHELFTMDDEDFLRSDCVVGNTQIEAMVTLLNKLLLRLYRLEITADSGAPTEAWVVVVVAPVRGRGRCSARATRACHRALQRRIQNRRPAALLQRQHHLAVGSCPGTRPCARR